MPVGPDGAISIWYTFHMTRPPIKWVQAPQGRTVPWCEPPYLEAPKPMLGVQKFILIFNRLGTAKDLA
eukprot:6361745-Amphidinium_carterae.1